MSGVVGCDGDVEEDLDLILDEWFRVLAWQIRGFELNSDEVGFGRNALIEDCELSTRTDAAGDPTAKKLAVGGVYNLSKRTAAYATYAHLENKGPSAVGLNGSSTATGKNSDGFDLGLKHTF